MICTLCPRRCGAERTPDGGAGFCGMPSDAVVAYSGLHFYEEPCISGTRGSGAVFFSGCILRCVFCQNRDISRVRTGKTVSPDGLRAIYDALIAEGAHNINLVTAGHFAYAVSESLAELLPVPVVYNTSGYETEETLDLFNGKVQIYLPDLKYSYDRLAEKYSAAPGYADIALKAILNMYDQVGDPVIDENGIMKSGVIIRHLIIPGELENTYGVIDMIADNFKKGSVMLSLMRQYTPMERYRYENLNRRVSDEEYEKAKNYMYLCGITDGFIQDGDSARDVYTPDFKNGAYINEKS